jgi:hypothetical protein
MDPKALLQKFGIDCGPALVFPTATGEVLGLEKRSALLFPKKR